VATLGPCRATGLRDGGGDGGVRRRDEALVAEPVEDRSGKGGPLDDELGDLALDDEARVTRVRHGGAGPARGGGAPSRRARAAGAVTDPVEHRLDLHAEPARESPGVLVA